MAKAPVMPLFTDALIGDTMHLSDAEFGSYMLLLVATWRNNGTALPDDDKMLAKVCRVSYQKWRTSRRRALASFFHIDPETGWHQKRLEKEWQRVETLRKRGKQGGKQSANQRANQTPSDEPTKEPTKTQANGQEPLTMNLEEGVEPYSSIPPLPEPKSKQTRNQNRAPAPSAAPPSRGSASAPPARPTKAKPTTANGSVHDPPIPLSQARIDLTPALERTGHDRDWVHRQLRAFIERDPLGDFRRSQTQWTRDWDQFLEARLKTRAAAG